ncbi:MAG: hypothetical protein RIR12_1199 [Bacteroidota bacterium]|jgi:hypothetical protein
MTKKLPLFTFLAVYALAPFFISAQSTDNHAYAITDAGHGSSWTFLRKLNLETGVFSEILLDGNEAKQAAYSATNKKLITHYPQARGMGFNEQPAFSGGVAAMAYDKKNNRLYYTPMFIDQLRYIDLKTMNVFYVDDIVFSGKSQKSPDQGNIVTRMVIADDGYGYAITNDGTQLLRFTTERKITVQDLGTLIDAPENKDVSIHNSCSSYGGDVIADDNGGLYILSARNHLFKVDINTKIATHLGVINGLPASFTINGAVVAADNKIVVSTAQQAASYFVIDLKSMQAASYTLQGAVWQCADMANGNVYATGKKATPSIQEMSRGKLNNTDNGMVSVYPNPVTDNRFTMHFSALKAGIYVVQLTDAMGKVVLQQNIVVSGDNSTEQINISPGAAKGIYLVKVLNSAKLIAYSTKIIVQ